VPTPVPTLLVDCGDDGVDEVSELEIGTLGLDSGKLEVLLGELCGSISGLEVVITLLLVVSGDVGAVLEDVSENTGPIEVLELVVSLLGEVEMLTTSLVLEMIQPVDVLVCGRVGVELTIELVELEYKVPRFEEEGCVDGMEVDEVLEGNTAPTLVEDDEGLVPVTDETPVVITTELLLADDPLEELPDTATELVFHSGPTGKQPKP
jgi:hypothetical protein